MNRNPPVIVLAALAFAAGPASAGRAVAGQRHRPEVHVSPATGSPSTRFVVSFRAPERTGRYGASERSYVLSARAPDGAGGACVGSVSISLPDSAKGARVRVTLAPTGARGALFPARPPQAWCDGTYHGEIEEIQGPVCRTGELCPAFVLLRATVGSFSFVINRPPGSDAAAPTFAGIQRAFACTPGPQRPGQTTLYNLSWLPASDSVTPSSEIVYDVYSSNRPGGEDFSHPSWTTAPGVTSFLAPGLAAHGTFYFVVRARDRAGNEDRNKVELQGRDPCY